MVTLATAETVFEVTAKVADVDPALTTTEVGTVAAEVLLLASATVTADGAAKLRVTVPVALAWPPSTADGLTPTLLTVTGFTVSV
jgi:hypothetical protein